MVNRKDESSEDFGQRLRQLRREHAHTQSQLAASLGISFQQVGKYERGIDWMSIARIMEVCRLYKVNLDYFLKHTDTTPTAHTKTPELSAVLDMFKALPKAKQKAFMRSATKLVGDV